MLLDPHHADAITMSAVASFSLEIAYGQIGVFDASLAQPFNDWTDAHVRQGFSWRSGSVSFRTLEGAGAIAVHAFVMSAEPA